MLEDRIYILGAVALVLLALLSWYAWRWLKKTRHQRHVESVIKSLGFPMIRDVVLPDGLEGLAFVDYLLLVPNGVVALDIQHVDGHLFGGKNVDQWSQVLNNHTYKFNNPLYKHEAHCQAILWNVDQARDQLFSVGTSTDWQVFGWVVFSNFGNFPKGIPEQVSMIDDLVDNLSDLNKHGDEIDATSRRIWEYLHNLSINTRAELSD